MRKKRNAAITLKTIAILLIAGGIAGVIVGISSEIALLSGGADSRAAASAVIAALTCVFAFSLWTGIALWKQKSWAFLGAQILLIAQIPKLSFPGFAYQFYTALMVGVEYSRQPEARTNFEMQLGSALTVKISSEIEGFIAGLNLIAIAALYLLSTTRATTESNTEPVSFETHA